MAAKLQNDKLPYFTLKVRDSRNISSQFYQHFNEKTCVCERSIICKRIDLFSAEELYYFRQKWKRRCAIFFKEFSKIFDWLPHRVIENISTSWSLPRLRARPKWLLIRPSQTKATSDQTDSDWSVLWLDYRALEYPCALRVRSRTASGQTTVCSKTMPWSD